MLVKDYILPLLLSDPNISSILNTEQKEINNFNNKIEDLLKQCFIETATWGIDFWENLLMLNTDKNKPLKQRREIIKATLIGHGVVTKKLIQETAAAFTDGEVEVTENIEPFTIQIKFTSTTGVPPGLSDLVGRINKIKPAHLLVKYEFKYNTYLDIQAYRFKTLNAYTWEELNSGEITDVFSHKNLKKYTHKQLGGIL